MVDRSGKETSDDLIPHNMSPNKIMCDSSLWQFGRYVWRVSGATVKRRRVYVSLERVERSLVFIRLVLK